MSRRRWSRLAVAAVVVAAAALAWRLSSRHAAEATPGAHAPRDGRVALTPAAAANNPIAVAQVTRARLAADLTLVGSVAYDQSRYAVVGPLVAGRVVALRAGLGDVVRKGELLAEIESAEVGQAQAAWLSATARAHAAEANARRERALSAEHVSSAREEELAASAALSEAAEARAATERLRAFGLGAVDLEALAHGGGGGGRVPLRAPLSGTVVARAIALGQAVERGSDAFQIVDLSHLWVLLDVHEKDLARVHAGQRVELTTDAGGGAIAAVVGYLSPIVDDKTRTAHVRIAFDNGAGRLRPGQYVTARLRGDAAHGPPVLVVPERCLTRVEGKLVAFVRGADGRFARRAVEAGAAAGELVEVRSGLSEGEAVASDGAFLLKSELLR